MMGIRHPEKMLTQPMGMEAILKKRASANCVLKGLVATVREPGSSSSCSRELQIGLPYHGPGFLHLEVDTAVSVGNFFSTHFFSSLQASLVYHSGFGFATSEPHAYSA